MSLTVGWEEWVALPELGVPAIRAKIDTGAQTSSLHAFSVHPFTENGRERVRIGLHPLPDRPDIEIYAVADLVGRREITSSNGETELRFIIATPIRLGGREWTTEISLANREGMNYRMLLGRRALAEGIVVDVTRALIHGEPDLSVYDTIAPVRAADRSLAIALLTGDPNSREVERLREAAEARGHRPMILDADRCYVSMTMERGLEAHFDGKALPRFDIVLPHLNAADLPYGLAVLRQLESIGGRSLNGSAALAAAWDKLHAVQLLARRGVRLPATGFANSPRAGSHIVRLVGGTPLTLRILDAGKERGAVVADTRKAAISVLGAMQNLDAHVLVQEAILEAGGTVQRCLVIGRRVVAAVKLLAGEDEDDPPRPRRSRTTREERRLAARAVAALGLQSAAVDLVRSEAGPMVVDVDTAGALDLFERIAGIDAAALIIAHLEQRAGHEPKGR